MGVIRRKVDVEVSPTPDEVLAEVREGTLGVITEFQIVADICRRITREDLARLCEFCKNDRDLFRAQGDIVKFKELFCAAMEEYQSP